VPDPTGADAGALADRDDLQIALVLNGGVSLAVWMSGAVFELDRLRRADLVSGLAPKDSPGAVLDRIVGATLALTQRRVTIDLVAGTSAGGINGALLGAAIANGNALTRDDLLGTWLRLGDLSRLLRPTNDDRPPSLLKGDAMLLKGLRGVVCGLLPSEAAPAGGPRADVSLLLTGTDLAGVRAEVRPRSGPFYQEHRVLFRFAHPPRQGWAALVPTGATPAKEIARDLALAGRSSASFPAAFEGSRVRSPPWMVGVGDPPVRMPREGVGWRQVVDGGVLDNSPFQPLLRQVDGSPSGAELERTVVFVTPYDDDPQPPDDGASGPVVEPADLLETVGGAGALQGELASVNNYVRFSEQMRRYRASRRTDVVRDLLADSTPAALAAIAAEMLPAYRNARWRSATAGLFGDDGAPQRQPCKWLPESFDGGFWPWRWGTAPVRRVAAFAARSLAAARAEIPPQGSRLRRLLMEWEREVRAVLRALSDAERERVVDYESRPGDRLEALDASWTVEQRASRARMLRAVVGRLVDAARAVRSHPRLDPASRAAALRALGQTREVAFHDHLRALLAAEVIVETGDKGSSAGAELAPELDLVTLRGGSGGGERQLWVTHALGETHGGEPVRTKDTLLGMSLRHFGGFLFCSWRANDWMFGRLDAADTITRLVLSEARLQDLGGTLDPEERWAVAGAFEAAVVEGLALDDDAVAGAFREVLGLGDDTDPHGEVRRLACLALAAGDGDDVPDARARLRAAVAWRMQGEILREELPSVSAAVTIDRTLGGRLPTDAAGGPHPGEEGGPMKAPPLRLDEALDAFRRYQLPAKGRLRQQWLTAPMVGMVARSLFVARAALGRRGARRPPPSVLLALSEPLRAILRIVRGWSAVPLWVATGVWKALFPAIARSFLPMALIAYLLAMPAADWTTAVGILVAVLLGLPWLVLLAVSLASAEEQWMKRSLRALVPIAAAALGAATGVWARIDDDLDQPAAGLVVLGAWILGASLVGRIEERDGIDPPPPRRRVSAP
jgi:predicted acylesterase/phospholipase RssA